MLYEVYITPSALFDIKEAINFYNSKLDDLGSRFYEDLENNIKSIQIAPTAFAERYTGVRGKLMRKFPFIILYNINQEHIQIIRIFNTNQNPFWE
jgi:hypothetical protein